MTQTAVGSTKPGRTMGNNPVLRLLIITAVIFVAFSVILQGKFFSIPNLQSMAVQFPEYGILAIAMFVCMITGGIDLSVVGAANLASILAAFTLTRLAPDGAQPVGVILLAMLVALAVGAVAGLLNGLLVARVGIPAMLATMGTSSLYMGLSYVITGGPAITTTQLAFLGSGSVLGVPYPVIIFVVLAITFALVMSRTPYGFNVYMLGTNATAARFSGINNNNVLMRTYLVSGLLAAVAGIVFLARANSAKPDYGTTFVLLTVLISILGGVSYNGGFGRIAGLVLAVLSLQFLSTGLNMLMLQLSGSSAAIFFRQFAWGALLLLVMVLNYYSTERQNRST